MSPRPILVPDEGDDYRVEDDEEYEDRRVRVAHPVDLITHEREREGDGGRVGPCAVPEKAGHENYLGDAVKKEIDSHEQLRGGGDLVGKMEELVREPVTRVLIELALDKKQEKVPYEITTEKEDSRAQGDFRKAVEALQDDRNLEEFVEKFLCFAAFRHRHMGEEPNNPHPGTVYVLR